MTHIFRCQKLYWHSHSIIPSPPLWEQRISVSCVVDPVNIIFTNLFTTKTMKVLLEGYDCAFQRWHHPFISANWDSTSDWESTYQYRMFSQYKNVRCVNIVLLYERFILRRLAYRHYWLSMLIKKALSPCMLCIRLILIYNVSCSSWLFLL